MYWILGWLPGFMAWLWFGMHPAVLASAADDWDVIINEIHYHPDSDLEKEEYVELYNRGTEPVDLGGWAFSQGIHYVFPPNTVLPADGYLLVVRNPNAVAALAPGVTLLGEYEGELANKGERLTLFNRQGEIVDSVKYQDEPPWPTSPDGQSPSLERISPAGPSSDPRNWMAAVAEGGGTGKPMTPGRRNSVFSPVLPPYVEQVTCEPACPKPGQEVTVTVSISDETDVDRVNLIYQPVRWSAQNQAETVLSLHRVAGTPRSGSWSVSVPGQMDRTLVRFRVTAENAAGVERVYPAATEARSTLSYFHYQDSETSPIPIVFVYDFGNPDSQNAFRGDSTFVLRRPGAAGWEVYDHIIITPRKGGYNVFFLNHYEFDGMSQVNLVFEPKPRYVLAEWLSYHVHRSVGVLAGNVDHYRLIYNNQNAGYYLMFEQPNKTFIERSGLNNNGNLYKILWNFDRSLTVSNISRQHQKKTHPREGNADVIEMVQTLNTLRGDEQRVYIESHLAVQEIMDYFVACQLTSDWDGYFNNHFVYHDTEGSGLWYIFPWDKDKTWGDSDAYYNILPYYDFYDMPILFGANGTPRSGRDNGVWWRPPGFISGAFLSHPAIQRQYFHRLGFAAQNEFTPERWIPVIDALEQRLEPEVRFKAQITGADATRLLTEFHNDIESFRRQVINRRQFILNEVEKQIGPVSVDDWAAY